MATLAIPPRPLTRLIIVVSDCEPSAPPIIHDVKGGREEAKTLYVSSSLCCSLSRMELYSKLASLSGMLALIESSPFAPF